MVAAGCQARFKNQQRSSGFVGSPRSRVVGRVGIEGIAWICEKGPKCEPKYFRIEERTGMNGRRRRIVPRRVQTDKREAVQDTCG